MVSAYGRRFYATKLNLASRRIKAIGFQVDHHMIERYTMEPPRFSNHLEAIKFISKDFWSGLFKKQIDNFEDQSQEDNEASQGSSSEATSMLLHFPCGIIRGAFSNVGILVLFLLTHQISLHVRSWYA